MICEMLGEYKLYGVRLAGGKQRPTGQQSIIIITGFHSASTSLSLLLPFSLFFLSSTSLSLPPSIPPSFSLSLLAFLSSLSLLSQCAIPPPVLPCELAPSLGRVHRALLVESAPGCFVPTCTILSSLTCCRFDNSPF
jgi:hypothetical protein